MCSAFTVTVFTSLDPVPDDVVDWPGAEAVDADNDAAGVADDEEDASRVITQLPRPFRPYQSRVSSFGHLLANFCISRGFGNDLSVQLRDGAGAESEGASEVTLMLKVATGDIGVNDRLRVENASEGVAGGV